MRKLFFMLCLLGLAAGCAQSNKYSAMRPEYGGQVEFPQWPALPQGAAGYNLYMAAKAEGPWEKITDIPITGGRMLVPYLDPGKEYFFRLTSVAKGGAESRPGQAFKRKAVAAPKSN
jgi:hypothetical protein